MPEVLCDAVWCKNCDGVHCTADLLEIKERGVFVYAICNSYDEKEEYKME